MKKLLVAIDNTEILNVFKNIENIELLNENITYKEGVIEYIAKNNVDIILTKDSLEGDMTKEIYTKQLKMVSKNAKIILFVEELNDIYKSFLFANEIFNIITDTNISTKKLINLIYEDKSVVYLDSKLDVEGQSVGESNLEYNICASNVNIVSKKKIAVFGTSGAGKSYVASLMASHISNVLNLKTLLLDLDISNSATDIYNNLEYSNNILSDIVAEIDNNTFNNTTIEGFSQKSKSNKNLSYITNNSSVFECQEKLGVQYYDKIYTASQNNFDVVIADSPSSPFLDATMYSVGKADKIIFVINPNYISIRQAYKYLSLMINVWNISKDKIFIVLNKVLPGSLDKNQVESLLGYNVKLQIKYNKNLENVINGIDVDYKIKIEGIEKIYEIFGIENESKLKQSSKRAYNYIDIFSKKIGIKQ